MRYSKNLINIGDLFRKEKFPLGSEYICAHLRRGDFVWAHKENIPSLLGAANKVKKYFKKLKKINLKFYVLLTLKNNVKINFLRVGFEPSSLRTENLKLSNLSKIALRQSLYFEVQKYFLRSIYLRNNPKEKNNFHLINYDELLRLYKIERRRNKIDLRLLHKKLEAI